MDSTDAAPTMEDGEKNVLYLTVISKIKERKVKKRDNEGRKEVKDETYK